MNADSASSYENVLVSIFATVSLDDGDRLVGVWRMAHPGLAGVFAGVDCAWRVCMNIYTIYTATSTFER